MTTAVFVPVTEVWQLRGLCAQTDPGAFFPEKGGPARDAKRVCLGCEVRAECLEYALAHDERHGVWGGLSERERRPLRRQEAKERASRFLEDYIVLRDAGLLDSQIAQRLGIKAESLRQQLYRRGIAPRPGFAEGEK